jgi:hypothetical protein
MNPDSNKFEPVYARDDEKTTEEPVKNEPVGLLRADGTPVPKHWSVFKVGEHVVIKDYTFEVKYIGETAILFEPVGPRCIQDTGDGLHARLKAEIIKAITNK